MLTVIVPYRDRQAHLSAFLRVQFPPRVTVLIVEQANSYRFNRGRLLNIGFLESTSPYVVFHDVDMLPQHPEDYHFTNQFDYSIRQWKKSEIQTVNYLGGVTCMQRRTFEELGGYHNDYDHRAEDNELFFQSLRKQYRITNEFADYYELNHERPAVEFDSGLFQQAQRPREVDDQLSDCTYEKIYDKVWPSHRHIKVLF